MGTRMKLSATDVSRIASQVIQDVSSELSVTGVGITGGDTGYAEVHVTVLGCHVEPCHLILSVFRDVSEDVLRRDITASLRSHLDRESPPSADPGV
jgi:hypothetical protein